MDRADERRADAVYERIVTFLRDHWEERGVRGVPRVLYLNPQDLDAIRIVRQTGGDWPRVKLETDYGTIALAASHFQKPGTFAATKG